MSHYRQVIIARTALLLALVVSAGAFAFAVHEDKVEGTLLDNEGVIDRQMVMENPSQ
ncbi:MAG: hypothetical protein P8008_02850 [Gammaproteobacteria bacterium]